MRQVPYTDLIDYRKELPIIYVNQLRGEGFFLGVMPGHKIQGKEALRREWIGLQIPKIVLHNFWGGSQSIDGMP